MASSTRLTYSTTPSQVSPARASGIYEPEYGVLTFCVVAGTRSLAIDLGEVEGSLGTTPFYSRQATTIPFSIGDERGVVLIEKVREGWREGG